MEAVLVGHMEKHEWLAQAYNEIARAQERINIYYSEIDVAPEVITPMIKIESDYIMFLISAIDIMCRYPEFNTILTPSVN